ncbi:MAG: 50S ribosomal protein L18e [Candidatus Bathyarchaeia archaeon]
MRKNLKNPNLWSLIKLLKRKSKENKAPVWKAIAELLSSSRSLMRCVNVSKIARYSNEGEIVVIPGKVLGAGSLTSKLTVVAYRFSEGARKKILEAGGECISFYELLERNPEGKNVKILG